LWNCPCGYLDFDETTKQAAMREVFEETGVQLTSAKFWGYDDSPHSNLQNVTFRFYSIITNPQPSTVSVSTEGRGGEADEVGAISWIPINKIDEFEWAFEHNLRIAELVKELELV
jgi:8-oxo-dGTP pyrophosphatase MutT (NUDIX family)